MSAEELHDMVLAPDHWWGCEQPERPYDEREVWDERCPKCRMRMHLVLVAEGDVAVYEATEGDWIEDRRPKGDLSVLLAELDQQ